MGARISTLSTGLQIAHLDLGDDGAADGDWIDFPLPWLGDGLLMMGFPIALPDANEGTTFDMRTNEVYTPEGVELGGTFDPNDPGSAVPAMVGYLQFAVELRAGASFGFRRIGTGVDTLVWYMGWLPHSPIRQVSPS